MLPVKLSPGRNHCDIRFAIPTLSLHSHLFGSLLRSFDVGCVLCVCGRRSCALGCVGWMRLWMLICALVVPGSRHGFLSFVGCSCSCRPNCLPQFVPRNERATRIDIADWEWVCLIIGKLFGHSRQVVGIVVRRRVASAPAMIACLCCCIVVCVLCLRCVVLISVSVFLVAAIRLCALRCAFVPVCCFSFVGLMSVLLAASSPRSLVVGLVFLGVVVVGVAAPVAPTYLHVCGPNGWDAHCKFYIKSAGTCARHGVCALPGVIPIVLFVQRGGNSPVWFWYWWMCLALVPPINSVSLRICSEPMCAIPNCCFQPGLFGTCFLAFVVDCGFFLSICHSCGLCSVGRMWWWWLVWALDVMVSLRWFLQFAY